MTRPDQIFLFNSSLPEGKEIQDFLLSMGASFGNIRGKNIGNTYISYGFLKSLFGRLAKVKHVTNVWEQDLSDELVDQINQNHSHFIFILQDYIREDFIGFDYARLNKFLRKIKLPVTPLSLCANSFDGFDMGLIDRLSPGQKNFLAILSEKSKTIGVRGYYSAEILNLLGIKNVKTVGCPSYFENGPTRIVTKKPWNADKVITTATFFNKGLPHSSHILQDELYFINLLFLGGKALPPDANITARPFNLDEIPTSFQLLAKAMTGRLEFFSDLNQWGDFFRNNGHCLTIGTRLHSGMFSINNGVPAIVTNPDARARETCEYLKIPYDPSIHSNSNIQDIYENLDLDEMNSAYPVLYKEFLNYLEEHGLTPTATPSDTPCFEFPQMQKSNDPSVTAELHRAFTELIDSVDREVVTLRTFGGKGAMRAIYRLRAMESKHPSFSSSTYYSYLKRTFPST